MKLKNKTLAWIYGIAVISAIFNSYVAYKSENLDAAIAWFAAAGLSCGAFSGYLELAKKEKEDEI